MLNLEIIKTIERYAPPSLQESWDNTGLQVGSAQEECTGVLICFDVTPEVVEEAMSLGYNLIISHHPLFFKGEKRLTGSTPQQVSAMNAIAAGITIYSTHTASDSTKGGVSYLLAKQIGVTPLRVLSPLQGKLVRLDVMVPDSHLDDVRIALFDAGAGAVGNYDCCSFNISGTGTFRPLAGSDPSIGEEGVEHQESETMISVVLPTDLIDRVEAALLEVHPYETPAYQFIPMLNKLHTYGLGIYGVMDEALSPEEFLGHVKKALGASSLRTTRIPDLPDMKIRRVAMCGGAGHEFISKAISMGAQAYISADLKYHDFVDYQDRILLVDAGHYETESFIKKGLAELLRADYPDLKEIKCAESDNPVHYF
ncbi:MAG: Nif3-like dinuclear metal center hexameric protein [Muribaculaceae bacterium]|nr:Nif3-like dinuclear metal center hexameric protein [Muribaculaceae bacterium]